MATNIEILNRIDALENKFNAKFAALEARTVERIEKGLQRLRVDIDRVEDMSIKNDEQIRGNGGRDGLRSQVADNARMVKEIRWYFRGVTAAVIVELIIQTIRIAT